jgi:Bacterial Ig domain
MRRNTIVAFIAFTVLAAAAASAAPPFGSFGGIVGGGTGGAGILPIFGWALDDGGVQAVDIYVDGIIAGRAYYGTHRPGVAAAYPSYPDAQAAGFGFNLNTTHYLNGLHTITPRVISLAGETTDLTPRVVQFTNLTHNLVPFGAIEFPESNAEMFGTCNPAAVQRRLSVVSGYALDSGVEIGDQGVGYVELLIDGSIFANSRRDCFYSVPTGGLTECYGLRRVDIAENFPSLANSVHSGFRFVLDIGDLLDFGYAAGQHVLTIRAGDISGQVSNIDEFPVTFLCDDLVGNEGSFGTIGQPANGQTYSGVIDVFGWALDFEGISQIVIYVDGAQVGIATQGFPRPGVTAMYPGYPQSAAPGYSFAFDTTTISDGEHHFEVLVRDVTGAETLIGERTFNVFNP